MPRKHPWSPVTCFGFAFLLLLTGPLPVVAQESAFDPAAFDVGLEPVAEGFAAPLYVTHAGDDRLFVVEQSGTIRIVEEGNVVETPFLDITDRVGSDASERGLLGLAFAPNYAESGFFYVNYTDRDGNTVVARFAVTDDANVADSDSEEVVLTQEQPYPC
ncbi:MAG: PQQ-dependent sugar dehydrogenase, partial [Chloroflexota bacterium]|nr:PQQ-dependent sugar dehydrogenase [Chloroflexota bacterium]